jgi:transcriptional regulator with XRE-family HTH domain
MSSTTLDKPQASIQGPGQKYVSQHGTVPTVPRAEALPARTMTLPDRGAHQPDHPTGIRSPTKSDFSIGSKLRELRRARMITQKELAAMVGVTGAQLHRYEMGTTRVAASRLISIAEALGVNADTLMGAATGHEPSPMGLALGDGQDDIIELINIFCSIREPKNRSAIIAVARMLSAKGTPARETVEQE